jgi:hypothetical protein
MIISRKKMASTPTDRKLKWPTGIRQWLLAIDIVVFILSLFFAALSDHAATGVIMAASAFVMLAMTPVTETGGPGSRSNRFVSALYCLISFIPLVTFVLLYVFLSHESSKFGPTDADQEAATLILFFLVSVVMLFIVLPREMLFIVRATKNTRMPVEWRVMWAIMLLPGGPILMPLYWFLFDRTRAQSLCNGNPAPEEQHVCSKRQ